MMLSLPNSARHIPMMEMMTTIPLASHIRFLSEMWTLSVFARMSFVMDDAETSSCEDAVDMMAARMAAKTTPRMNGAVSWNSTWAVYMNTYSESYMPVLKISIPFMGR